METPLSPKRCTDPLSHTGYALPVGQVDSGSMVTDARTSEYRSVVANVSEWATSQGDIVAVGVVGSWARGDQHDDSDVDIVVITTNTTKYAATDNWAESAVGQRIPLVRHAEWGVLTERRLQLPSGFEVEMGFGEPSWAATDPVDSGTAEVVTNGGLLPIYDPDRLLVQLARAVG